MDNTRKVNLVNAYEAYKEPSIFTFKKSSQKIGENIIETPLKDEYPAIKITNAVVNFGDRVEVRGEENNLVFDSRVAGDAKIEELKPIPLIKESKILNKQIWTRYDREDDIDRTLSWIALGNATWLSRSSARLTGNQLNIVGGLGAKNTTKSNNFNLSFEFRIYGSTTEFFADGISLFYSPNQLGGFGDGAGVASDSVFSVTIDSYNNLTSSNLDSPVLRIKRQGFADIESPATPSLRSEQWQSISFAHENNSLSVSVGTLSYTGLETITDENTDYYFRIAASTGTFTDIHEVRKIRFSNRKVKRR